MTDDHDATCPACLAAGLVEGTCRDCRGSGADPAWGPHGQCHTCHGRSDTIAVECDPCAGSGGIDDDWDDVVDDDPGCAAFVEALCGVVADRYRRFVGGRGSRL